MSSSPKPTANPADTLLRKVRKEAGNMSCPNCGTQAQAGIGFGNVCVKFKTFVCDSCKTSHQAISHRVKSITMSNWTMDEVNELLDANGGGNRAASHVWLQNAPPFGGRYPGGSRPKAGDRIEVFKQFVMDCYEYGKFKSNSPYQPSGDSGAPSPAVSPKPAAVPAQQQPRANNFAAPAPSPAPVAPAYTTNLLEVDDFFSSSTSSSKPTASSNNFADFANFSSNVSAQTATSSASFTTSSSSSTIDFDPFGTATSVSTTSTSYSFQQTSKSTESSTNFDLFNSMTPAPQQSTPTASQPASFDPFGSTTLTPTISSAPVQQNNNVFNFAQQPPPQQQQQGGNINNIMNMYGSSNTMGRPMPMGAGAIPQQGYRPNASSAISQMDVFGNNNHMQPRPMGGMGGMNGMNGMNAMGGMNSMGGMGGMGPTGGMNNMGGRNGMGPMGGMGAQYNAMQGGMFGGQSRMAAPQQTQQSNNSFDFLQDTMKKHLENPSTSYSQNQNNGMRSAPTNPFR